MRHPAKVSVGSIAGSVSASRKQGQTLVAQVIIGTPGLKDPFA